MLFQIYHISNYLQSSFTPYVILISSSAKVSALKWNPDKFSYDSALGEKKVSPTIRNLSMALSWCSHRLTWFSDFETGHCDVGTCFLWAESTSYVSCPHSNFPTIREAIARWYLLFVPENKLLRDIQYICNLLKCCMSVFPKSESFPLACSWRWSYFVFSERVIPRRSSYRAARTRSYKYGNKRQDLPTIAVRLNHLACNFGIGRRSSSADY